MNTNLKFNKLEFVGLFCSVAIIALCFGASNFTHAQNAPQVAANGETGDSANAQSKPNREFTQQHRAALAAAIDNPLRIDKARDKYRHPAETLEFFGILPSDSVIEIWPGQGWYASILGPYLRSGGGRYIGAHFDTSSTTSNLVRQIVDGFRSRFGSKPSEFGDLSIVPFGPRSRPLGPDNSVDAVLTFRNVHNWMSQGWAEKAFDDFYKVLKPGGILGIEEHRADDNSPQDPLAEDGYVREDYVIDMAKEAGFELVARSPINANPKDTKDHPFGVWTLPPVGRTSAPGQAENINFDKTRYLEIGESDRMTLLFRKPIAPPAPEKPKTTFAGIRVPFPVKIMPASKAPPPPAPPVTISAKKDEPIIANELPPPNSDVPNDVSTPPKEKSPAPSKTARPEWRPKAPKSDAKTAAPVIAPSKIETASPEPTSTLVVFEVPPEKPNTAAITPNTSSAAPKTNSANSPTSSEPKAKPKSATATARNSSSRASRVNNTEQSTQRSGQRPTSSRSSQTSSRTETKRPSTQATQPKASPKAKAAPAKKSEPAPNRQRTPEPKTKAKALNIPTWNPNPPKKK